MKTLITTSKEYTSNMDQYLFDSINNEDEEIKTLDEKILYAYSEFERVANYPHNLKLIPNDQKRFADYLKGLPFDFAYNYDNILRDASKLHNLEAIPATKEDTIINYWFDHIALNIIRRYQKIIKNKSL